MEILRLKVFLAIIQEHAAGSPQHDIRWTNLRPPEIALSMSEAGFPVSGRMVRPLLKQQYFVRRQSQKKKSFKQHPDRNPHFENITALKAKYLAAGQPVLSMAPRKKRGSAIFTATANVTSGKPSTCWITTSPATAMGKWCPMFVRHGSEQGPRSFGNKP